MTDVPKCRVWLAGGYTLLLYAPRGEVENGDGAKIKCQAQGHDGWLTIDRRHIVVVLDA